VEYFSIPKKKKKLNKKKINFVKTYQLIDFEYILNEIENCKLVLNLK
jgi:hypothetical protein